MSEHSLLRIENLCAGYHRSTIVHHAACEIVTGQVVALLGANGAGKTTLLKTAIGLLPRISGSVWLGDQPLSALSPRQRARRVAWVPQQSDPSWHYTVRELILQGRYAHLGPFASYGQTDEAAVMAAMRSMDVAAFSYRPLHELSGGEARRVLIARALAQDTPLLALDEPAAHLDPGRQVELMSLLRSIAAQGKAVLVSVHDINAARRFADRVLLIDSKGHTVFGPPDQVLTAASLNPAFETEFIEGRHERYGDFVLPLARLQPGSPAEPAGGASDDD